MTTMTTQPPPAADNNSASKVVVSIHGKDSKYFTIDQSHEDTIVRPNQCTRIKVTFTIASSTLLSSLTKQLDAHIILQHEGGISTRPKHVIQLSFSN